jgi:hypothetical protein
MGRYFGPLFYELHGSILSPVSKALNSYFAKRAIIFIDRPFKNILSLKPFLQYSRLCLETHSNPFYDFKGKTFGKKLRSHQAEP